MRLEKIKVAGFKSFIDQTTVYFPENITSIVGPNGCGKSNLIDAIRWVMGESSAKQLRGEQLSDVIFNGSSSRKPAGAASVELVFDNSDGQLGGQYANYNEISLRREIDREGQSVYFLNGTSCRRRDIVDIFLGTGLGPRSYAIIEQGIISKIIESKPEELRVYLEEAAGLSKYKERRRETENRLTHTQENLERLSDIREELSKQTSHLKRQATLAERYKMLKQQERLLKADLLGIRWLASHQQLETLQKTEDVQHTALYQCATKIQQIQIKRHQSRETEIKQRETTHQLEQKLHQTAHEIAKIEQHIAHTLERDKQRKQALQQLEKDLSALQTQKTADNAQLQSLKTTLEKLSKKLVSAKNKETESQAILDTITQNAHQHQSQWDQFQESASKALHQAETEQKQIRQLEQQHLLWQQKLTQLNSTDSSASQLPALEAEKTALIQQINKLEQDLLTLEAAYTQTQKTLINHRDQWQLLQKDIQILQQQLSEKNAEETALETLQKAAQQPKDQPIQAWLSDQALANYPRLWTQLTIEPGWEQAVEIILKPYLQAICTENFKEDIEKISALEKGSLALINVHSVSTPMKSSLPLPLLESKIQTSLPIAGLLAGIYAAENVPEALAFHARLSSHEFILTREGLCIGRHTATLTKNDQTPWLFKQRTKLSQLKRERQILEKKLSQQQQAFIELQTAQHTQENHRDQQQKNLSDLKQTLANLRGKKELKALELSQFFQNQQRRDQEKKELSASLSQLELSLKESKTDWQAAMIRLEQMQSQREALLTKKNRHQETRALAEKTFSTQQSITHQLALDCRTLETQQHSLTQALDRLLEQENSLRQKQHQLMPEPNAEKSPIPALESDRQAYLQTQLTLEKQLNESRIALSHLEHLLKEQAQEEEQQQQQKEILKQQLDNVKLNAQEYRLRQQHLEEQLGTLGIPLESLLKQLPSDALETEKQAELDKLTTQIHRLGPINLAAISEHAEVEKRKNYLDQQHADLSSAIETLREAILKIDHETKVRFQTTFDQANIQFQTLFPKIFKGGSAHLKLTDENWLNAGIIVMAKPPGKNISHIHLLSGGEKALTALALVFALFHLNPAPFCILDEVDAPLDDANVIRFCDLVKTMSSKIQFVYISHNKTAIEMATHLIGVTMNEPGVSRIVTVDIEQALALKGE